MTVVSEGPKRARVRSVEAAVKRTTRATMNAVAAMTAEALDEDKMSEGIAKGQYIEAERNLEAALTLIRDCRRSIEGE